MPQERQHPSVPEMAMAYYDSGLTSIPCLPMGKKPAICWQRYQNERPTRDEEMQLFRKVKESNIGIPCGQVNGGLIVLDCDDPQTFAETRERLRESAPPTWEAESGRGGHIYLYADREISTQKAGKIDVRGEGSIIIAPPSIHPSGVVYKFINGGPGSGIPIARVEWGILESMGIQPAREAPHHELPPFSGPRKPLDEFTMKLLNGDPEALAKYDNDRSAADCALCVRLLQAGYDEGAILRMFRDYPTSGKFAEKKRDGERYLRRTIKHAWQWLQENPAESSVYRPEIADMRQFASAHNWPGRTGARNRQVYLSFLDVATRAGKLEIGASCREIAEWSGMGRTAVSRALKANCRTGWIDLTQAFQPKTKEACRYKPLDVDTVRKRLGMSENQVSERDSLSRSRGDGDSTPSNPSNVKDCPNLKPPKPTHDVFRWGALGATGKAIYDVMLDGRRPMRVKEISELSGRSSSTVNRKLKLMFGAGLAGPLGNGYWQAVEGSNLDDAAEILGTSGKGEEQRRQHERERIQYDKLLERQKQSMRPVFLDEGLSRLRDAEEQDGSPGTDGDPFPVVA